jgi:hypothetical protein
MSAVPITSAPSSAQRVPMEVFVKGKIDARRRHESTWYTRLITPASDVYSRPQVVEVRSKSKLGEVGDETAVSCKLGGYTRKAFRSVDKETGETAMVTPVDLTLDAIES